MEKEKAMKKNMYSEELAKLRVVFEELKFTSERQMQKYVLCKFHHILFCGTVKLVFGISDQTQHKESCTVTEEGNKLEILDLPRRRLYQQ